MQINGKEYRLVPVEPDLNMVIAGENYIGRHAWKRMITAAPTPEATEMAQDALDAARWRAFRARDALPDLDYTAFQDQFRKDADAVIDAAIAAGGKDG